jgi:hypothetical protein
MNNAVLAIALAMCFFVFAVAFAPAFLFFFAVAFVRAFVSVFAGAAVRSSPPPIGRRARFRHPRARNQSTDKNEPETNRKWANHKQ